MGGTTNSVTAVSVGNVSGGSNLRQVLDYPSCRYSTAAADARHCLWSDIVASNTATYGGDSSWPAPDPQYLYGQKIQVPDVSGQTVKDAKAALQAAGFQVKTGGSTPSHTVPSGSVVSTDPAAGSSVVGGSLITLTKSSGAAPTQPTTPPTAPATATVPPVQGSPIAQALSTSQAPGPRDGRLLRPRRSPAASSRRETPGGGSPNTPTTTVIQLSTGTRPRPAAGRAVGAATRAVVVAGAAAAVWGVGIERTAFTVRRASLPVLAPGTRI